MTDHCQCDYCNRAQPDRTTDRLIPVAEVRSKLGGVSHMWIKRRHADPRLRFPERVMLGQRVFYWQSDIIAWLTSPHAKERTTNMWSRAA